MLGTQHSEVLKQKVELSSWIFMPSGVGLAKCESCDTVQCVSNINIDQMFSYIKTIAPKYTELASKFPHVQFLRVDVDKQQAIAAKYKITAMPTFIAIVDGEVKRTVRAAK